MKHCLAFLIAALLAAITAGPAAIAAEPEDPRVQAFIPLLNPAARVAVVYPESARLQDSVGMVQVLVTFDLTGKVTRAEALTGPGELRQAATDAVRQWTYRPVIRNGQAGLRHDYGDVKCGAALRSPHPLRRSPPQHECRGNRSRFPADPGNRATVVTHRRRGPGGSGTTECGRHWGAAFL